MALIKLDHSQWTFDPQCPLGQPGGFGAVYAGASLSGEHVAVKRLHVEAGAAAHRELRISSELLGRKFQNVIAVLDSGLDTESDGYFVVMPKAEFSLAQHQRLHGPMTEADTLIVLQHVVSGLMEVPNIVHRDLKPGNVLWHENAWKIADFGIARFVEEATSLRTVKEFLTPQYAAPEQWRFERATNATDVYALACIAYSLITGQPPFPGPDFGQQHLYDEPPPISAASPRLRSLLLGMLKKEGMLRPSLTRVRAQLKTILTMAPIMSPGLESLANVDARIGQDMAAAEAKLADENTRLERRRRIAKAANIELERIAAELFALVTQAANHVQPSRPAVKGMGHSYALRLGQGVLRVTVGAVGEVDEGVMPISRWDVITVGEISVEVIGTYQRSASLWFTNAGIGDEYRWYELSFMIIVGRADGKHVPFALTPGRDADCAIGPGMHTHQLATSIRPVDQGDQYIFFDRWTALFAEAAEGKLRCPSRLPLND